MSAIMPTITMLEDGELPFFLEKVACLPHI